MATGNLPFKYKTRPGKQKNRNSVKNLIYKLWQEETEESGFKRINRLKQGLLLLTLTFGLWSYTNKNSFHNIYNPTSQNSNINKLTTKYHVKTLLGCMFHNHGNKFYL